MARLTDVLALAEKANRVLAATEDLRGEPYTPPRPLVRIADQLATLQAVSEACAKVLHAPPPEVAEIRKRQAIAYLKQASALLERWDMPQIRKAQASIKAGMADPSLRPPKCEARQRVRRPGRAPRRGSNTHLRGSRRVTRAGPSSDDDPGESEPPRLVPRWQHGDSRPLAEAGR